jgi:uncharacterized membrane protein
MDNIDTPVKTQTLNISWCFTEAIDVYKKNVLMLILAAFLFQIISLFSLFIMAGPLYGGLVFMLLNAMSKENKKVELNDMFKPLNRFGAFLGLFSLQGVAILAGFLLVIPGIILTAMWLYSYYFMVDKNMGITDSMKASWDFVREKGFWPNLGLCFIYLAITIIPSYVPLIGFFLGTAVMPLALMLITSAYRQQAPKESPQVVQG